MIFNSDHRVSEDGRFTGIANRNLTVAAGVTCEVAGIVNGDLIVEPGGSARVTGIVNGEIQNRGGEVSD